MTGRHLDSIRTDALVASIDACGATGAWFRVLRRVHGHVRYSDSVVLGTDAVQAACLARDGEAVLPEFESATMHDVPTWNTWTPHPVHPSLPQDAVFRDAGAASRLHRLIVDGSGTLTGLLDLFFDAADGAAHAIDAADLMADSLDDALSRARREQRSRETVLQEGCLWLFDGQPQALCVTGKVLWNRPSVRSTIEGLQPPDQAFAGPMWLEASGIGDGVLVWALPSAEVAAPPLGALPDAARRVGLHLANGETVSSTAQKLDRGVETIRTQARYIRERLGTRSRLHLARTLQQVHWR